jgi:hypothetical protein
MENLENIDHIRANVDRTGGNVSGKKYDQCRIGVKIVGFVCWDAGTWSHASKVKKVWN